MNARLDDRSRELRQLVVDGLEGGQRGHVGSALSLIEILRVLFDTVLNYRFDDPVWPDRDRLILSKGHGCLALYALLRDKGLIKQSDLSSFCRYTSILGGHPEYGKTPGVEASTGSLGHGLAVGVGLAFAARLRSSARRTFVVCGDGELNEGSIWEAALAAAHHELESLTVIIDHNNLQSFGRLEDVWCVQPLAKKWDSFGFSVAEVDGHDVVALKEVLQKSTTDKPQVVIAHTTKGRGVEFAEHDPDWHHKSKLTREETSLLRAAIANA